MATRKEVAEYAGVSVATVSYVMNGTKNVTPAVRQRVEEAVRALNYQPNLVARSLVTKQTRHVAMFVNNLKNPYYSEVLEGAQKAASQNGYIVSLIMIDYSNQDEILKTAARGIEGAILAVAEIEELEKLLSEKMPCAKTDEYVDVDYRDGIFQAVQSLKRHGHENIAFFSGLRMDGERWHPRLEYIRDAFEKCRIPYQPELFIEGNETEDTDERAGAEAVRKLLKKGKEFSAVMTLNDMMALGAVKELKKNGLRVPEDVSVVGCDNTQIARYYIPSLSSIDVQAFQIGQLLMLHLLDLIHHRESEKTVIKTVYKERESVGDFIRK